MMLAATIPCGVIRSRVFLFAIAFVFCLFFSRTEAFPQTSESESRVTSGLQVLYDFSEKSGVTIQDRAGVGRPIPLRIMQPDGVRWNAEGLELVGKALIRSEGVASRLHDTIHKAGEVTVEAWIQPAHANQNGPARIVTISKNSSERNLTIGQEKDKFDVRLRTTRTSTNGIPGMESPANAAVPRRVHVVLTRNRDGMARLYLNGQLSTERKIEGDLSNWDSQYELALGNELSQDRPWQGTFYLVALYSRAMSPHEVQQNFKAGHQVSGVSPKENAALEQSRHFEAHVAPLLVNHCLECHDSATRKGGLDLSRKATAFRGGDSGKAIVAGDPQMSPVWTMVHANEMPAKRTPVSDDDKAILKKWIEQGAVWSMDRIDPAVYSHGRQAAGNWIRRLTIPEYIETVRATIGVDLSQEAREILPPDFRADGFSNTAYNLNVDLKHIQAYAQLAEIAVSKMDLPKFITRFTKSKRLDGDENRELTQKMGKWLLRGPLTTEEVIRFQGIPNAVASAGGSFEEAVGLTIEAMLQSPRFLYRIERQRGDGTAWPVDNYELATRLSYLVWGAPPDEELLRLAEKGEIQQPQQIRQQVERMLKDPRAVEQSVRFVDEWLNLKHVPNLRPNSEKFPHWNEALAEAMQHETRSFFKDIVWTQNRPLKDLLNAQSTFLNPELARHYNIDIQVDGFEKVDLKNVPSRGGVLTQGSTLTVGGDDASMVTRGLFVLHDLLRGVVKDPPPCVDTTPIRTQPNKTQRAIAMERVNSGTCGGCHGKFEPLAFALEKFDGLGSYHERDEHGNLLQEDGEVLFPGDEMPIPFQTTAELMDLLASSERVNECLTWKVVQFSVGRPLVYTDVPTVSEIHQIAQKNSGTWNSLIHAIAQSELIRTTKTETK